MVLFLAEWCLPPPEVAHYFCAMSKGLQRPKSHHARLGRWIVRPPVHRTWLLFHYPPPASPAGPIEIMVEGTVVRISGTEEFFAVLRRKERNRGQKTQRIGVPAGKIQVTGHLEMVEIRAPGHEIMGDRSVGGELTQDLYLNLLELPDHIGGKPAKIEAMTGNRVGECASWPCDFVEVAVFQAPENI